MLAIFVLQDVRHQAETDKVREDGADFHNVPCSFYGRPRPFRVSLYYKSSN
jgi:hypothetical protein